MRSAGSAAWSLPRYQLCQLQEVGLIIFRKGLARSCPSLLGESFRQAMQGKCGFWGIFPGVHMGGMHHPSRDVGT